LFVEGQTKVCAMLIKIIVEAEWEEQSFRRRIDRIDPSVKFETEPPRLFFREDAAACVGGWPAKAASLFKCHPNTHHAKEFN
jgi:hypothetical protein